MGSVSIRELRNHGGEVIDQVAAGMSLTVTRDGVEVALLAPLRRRSAPPSILVQRRRMLPPVDPQRLRAEIDQLIDPSL